MDNMLRRRWLPRGEAELRQAFVAGLLEERSWCDLKRELGTSKSANTELARDLASFAVDGGTLLIGVDETAPDGEPLYPVLLKGLCERIEQVADMKVDPPLQVECSTIPAEGDAAAPGTGYVLVHVPASPLAPHQVEGIYYGRGDKTKRRLPDAEIERLFRRRESWNQGVQNLLDEVVQADPYGGAAQHHPHQFILARPVAGWPEMCRKLVGENDWHHRLNELRAAVATEPRLSDLWNSTYARGGGKQCLLFSLSTTIRSAAGALLTTLHDATTYAESNERFTSELEIGEDGELRLYDSCLKGTDQEWNGVCYPGLDLSYGACLVREMLVIAREVSRFSNYAGMWDFGVALTAIKNAKYTPPVPAMGLAPLGSGYTGDSYRQTTRANLLELEKTPGAVTERLLGRLIRGLGASVQLRAVISDDEA